MTISRDDLDAGLVDLAGVTTGEKIPTVTPGEVLKEEFLAPMNLSAKKLAAALGVPTNRITGIINGTRAISAETAILLGGYFEMSPEFWLGLQMDIDLEIAREALSHSAPPPHQRAA